MTATSVHHPSALRRRPRSAPRLLPRTRTGLVLLVGFRPFAATVELDSGEHKLHFGRLVRLPERDVRADTEADRVTVHLSWSEGVVRIPVRRILSLTVDGERFAA